MSTDALARVVRGIVAEADAGFDAFRREVRPGRLVIATEVLGLAEALALPQIGPTVRDALLVARAGVLGLEIGRVCECALCRRPWTATRGPAALLLATGPRAGSDPIWLV